MNKNILKLLIMFLIICFNIDTVYAECTKENAIYYKDLTNNIMISYNYLENESTDNLFSITITNIPKEINVIETKLSNWYTNITNDSITSVEKGKYSGGSTLSFSFYTSENSNCPDYKVKQQKLKLPVYNKYHTDELCNGIEEYKYCNKLIDYEITYEGFKKNVLKYKKSLHEETIIEDEKNTMVTIKEIINKYKIPFIISLIIIITIIILVVHKSKKRRDLI